jgi:two-component system, OmpR family, sensor histidine kinase ArlS
MSIRFKIALLFALLVTLILTIVSVSVYFFSVQERTNAFKNRLRNRAYSTAKIYADITDTNYNVLRRMDIAAVSSLYNKSITITGYNNNLYEYCYTDSAGDSLLLSKNIIDQAKIHKEYYFTYNSKKAIAIQHIDDGSNFIVAVAALDIDGQEYLQQLKKILVIALLLAVLLSYIVGLIFAKNLINPIKRITNEVNQITSNNIARRIEINDKKDELTKLAETFNNLLDRLQDSFFIQRRFISNASHELSTPLTSISSQLEVSLQKSRTTEEYKEVMYSIYEDVKDLQQLTRSLLDIAKTGSEGSIDLEEVRLDEVLFKVVADIKKQNQQFKVVLNLDTFPENEKLLTVFGNTNLLYISLKNIIENGCKYSNNFQSAITAIFDEKYVEIQVANNGDVIAEADIQNIFQPFFRTDSAQQKPGFGLGLTLTKKILALHKGSISVESGSNTGTVFTLRLPNILFSV